MSKALERFDGSLVLLRAELRAEEPGIQFELMAGNGLTDLLRRDADIAVRTVRTVRPVQASLVARESGTVGIGAAVPRARHAFE